MREMRTDAIDGVAFAFAAAQDADQEGEEGLFYTWSAGNSRSPRRRGRPSSPPPMCGGRQLGRQECLAPRRAAGRGVRNARWRAARASVCAT